VVSVHSGTSFLCSMLTWMLDLCVPVRDNAQPLCNGEGRYFQISFL
jgi:hypothetical protein